MADLPEALRAARRRARLTQAQLGRRLAPPIGPSQISRYESGLYVPPDTLVQLAQILRLNLTVAPAVDVEAVAS